MLPNPYRDEVEKLIAQNKLAQALQRLNDILLENEELILFERQLHELDKLARQSVLSGEEQTRRYNVLAANVLKYLRSLEETELRPDLHLTESRFERIRVVCSEERETFYQRFRSAYRFEYFTCVRHHQAPGPDASNQDVLIFDYEQESEKEGLLAILRDEALPPALIFVRDRLQLLPEDREALADRYQFANSVFTLFPRLEEMLAVRRWWPD